MGQCVWTVHGPMCLRTTHGGGINLVLCGWCVWWWYGWCSTLWVACLMVVLVMEWGVGGQGGSHAVSGINTCGVTLARHASSTSWGWAVYRTSCCYSGCLASCWFHTYYRAVMYCLAHVAVMCCLAYVTRQFPLPRPVRAFFNTCGDWIGCWLYVPLGEGLQYWLPFGAFAVVPWQPDPTKFWHTSLLLMEVVSLYCIASTVAAVHVWTPTLLAQHSCSTFGSFARLLCNLWTRGWFVGSGLSV